VVSGFLRQVPHPRRVLVFAARMGHLNDTPAFGVLSMIEQSKGNATRNLTEDEIIRSVRFRYRICSYLIRTSTIWLALAVVISSFYDLFRDQKAQENVTVSVIFIVLVIVGGNEYGRIGRDASHLSMPSLRHISRLVSHE
jgi:hypothetical protein